MQSTPRFSVHLEINWFQNIEVFNDLTAKSLEVLSMVVHGMIYILQRWADNFSNKERRANVLK